MKKIPLFQQAVSIPNQRKHEAIASVLIFIILPVANCLIISAGKQSALYNSLSRLAWPEGLLWLVYLWGILNVGCFAYATQLALLAGGYDRPWRKLVNAFILVFALFLTVGISIPAYVDRGETYLILRSVHTALSAVGFFGFYLVLLFLSATLFGRNGRQALLSLCLNAFILVIGVFFLVKVSDPNSYCHVSAPAQTLLFDLFNAQALLNYFGMTLFPNEKDKKETEITNYEKK